MNILIFLLAAPWILFSEQLKLQVHAESALLMNAKTGAILYEKHARKIMYPASITKIATAMLVLKLKGDKLDEIVTVDQEDIAMTTEEAKIRSNYIGPAHELVADGTQVGLKREEKIALKELLYGTMLRSGNDAANAMARHVGGTIPKFIAMLNKYLKHIGCKNTHFLNPHGLFHPKHQTTAYDMAIMTKEALNIPAFAEIVSTLSYPRAKSNKQEAGVFIQSNKLLKKGPMFYAKAIGVKTGYLAKAGHTLVAAARDGDRTLIAVLLKTKQRKDMFLDAIKMFETAFSEKKVEQTLFKEGKQTFELLIEGANKPVKTWIEKDAIVSYFLSEETKMRCFLYWNDFSLPIKKNQRVGQLKIQADKGHELLTVPLLAQEEVESTWTYWLKQLWCLL